VTHGTTESTADTPQVDQIFSIRASVTGLTQRGAHVHDVDNVAQKHRRARHRDDSVIMAVDTSSTPALDSRIAVTSHDSDGFTHTMLTNTNNWYIVGYLAFG
jgi:hypothetical protein